MRVSTKRKTTDRASGSFLSAGRGILVLVHDGRCGMTALASFITSSAASRRALSKTGFSPPKTAPVRSMDVVTGLEIRTTDLLNGVGRVARGMSSRRAHSDPVMFSPEQRARNIAMSCLVAHSEARRGDLKSYDGYLVEMKSRIPPTRDVLDAVDALNAKRDLLRMATAELGKLIHAVEGNDMSAAEDHRRNVEDITAAVLPAPVATPEMTAFEYLVQRSRSQSFG